MHTMKYYVAVTVHNIANTIGGSLIEPKPHSHKLRPAETPAIQTIVKTGYNKPSYPVLVGDTVRLYATKTFTALPHLSKYMVKERLPNSSKPRLVLKSSETERSVQKIVSIRCCIHQNE